MKSDNYDDIINTKYPFLLKYPRMSIRDRAAQFSAFKSLSGYDAEIEEIARITDSKIELDECSKNDLNSKIQILKEKISDQPLVRILYFVPDAKKDGGTYVSMTANRKKIDKYSKTIITVDDLSISIDDIYQLDGELFEQTKN